MPHNMLFSEHDPGVAHRVRRDAPPYGPPAPAPYHPAPHHGPKGRVGPVYTFVKTDPQVMHPIFLEAMSLHKARNAASKKSALIGLIAKQDF